MATGVSYTCIARTLISCLLMALVDYMLNSENTLGKLYWNVSFMFAVAIAHGVFLRMLGES